MIPLVLITIALVVAMTAFYLLWRYQKTTGDSSIVDVAWSLSVGALATFFCWQATGGNTVRRWILALMAIIWATRLAWHVYQRLKKHTTEDGRYLEMKEAWADQADAKMLRFYQFQAIASVLFALPMLIAAFNPSPLGWIDYVGASLFILALTGESVADIQLERFRNEPSNKGKVCRDGLWNYSRHPNYFFEWLHWWSYVCLAVSYPVGIVAIFAPMFMLFFILKVTGIPPTEKQALKSRGEAYKEYQRTTSAFFPWFPKPLPSTPDQEG